MHRFRSHRAFRFAACVLCIASTLTLALAGCAKTPTVPTQDATGQGQPGAGAPATENASQPADDGSVTDATPAAEPVTLKLYFPRGETLGVVTREVPATKAVATAALKELLNGTTDTDALYGFHTEIPKKTSLRSVTVKNKIATVDLTDAFDDGGGSLSMMMRVAQVVYTLTQFSTVQSVVFEMNGKPVEALGGEGIILDHPQKRSDWADMLPPIFVETPAAGATAKSPLRITGSANVFEATFQAEVRDASGKVLAKKTVTASAGTGTRGTFDVSIPFTSPRQEMGSLVVFEYSAKDGKPINNVSIPIKLTP
ncbi:MAG: GerMN domain-containing protein [Actinomycetia bacterium]|nr:GerMN domain-containing protein [Actinomycetes bacterium]